MQCWQPLGFCLLVAVSFANSATAFAADEPPMLTTLSNPANVYRIPKRPYVVMKRAGAEAIVVDNRAVDDDVLTGHRAGYSGLASLTHTRRKENLFVPAYAGMNFEHIHDGTVKPRNILFEPRNAPMQLRAVDEQTAELYQAPSPHYGLESCLRYHLMESGAIEMTLECIPRRRSFKNGYIGLFWASYIHQPESLDIHFRGHSAEADTDSQSAAKWIRGITPAHGELSTHLGIGDNRTFEHDADFPLSLVFNRSKHRYREPWYYGVSHGMALIYVFRPEDQIRMSQSPSGGGAGNPAWDFQFFIPGYQVGQRYQMRMRTLYVPFESSEQIARLARRHQRELQGLQ